jgi:HNH endonuclease
VESGPTLRELLWQHQGGVCPLCGEPIPETEINGPRINIDHRRPVSHGGGNERANLQLTHVPCNADKADACEGCLYCRDNATRLRRRRKRLRGRGGGRKARRRAWLTPLVEGLPMGIGPEVLSTYSRWLTRSRVNSVNADVVFPALERAMRGVLDRYQPTLEPVDILHAGLRWTVTQGEKGRFVVADLHVASEETL